MNFFTKAWRTVKAFAAFPKAATKAIFTLQNLHLSEWFRGLTAAWQDPSYEVLAKKAHRNPYAGRALHLIAQAISEVPLQVQLPSGDVETDHAALDLLQQPNPRQDSTHFFGALINHVFLGGEVWWEARRASERSRRDGPVFLYAHRPDRFQHFIVKGENVPTGWVDGLRDDERRRYNAAMRHEIVGAIITDKRGHARYLPWGRLYQARTYNPLDEDRGLPLLLSAARALEQMEAAADWNKSISKGAGKVPLYWKPEGLQGGQQLTDEQVAAAEDSLDRRTEERRTSNLGMVLSGSFTPVEGHISPREADFLEADKHNYRKLCAVLGVPSVLLSDIEGIGLGGGSSLKEAMKALYLLTGLPLLDWILKHLNRWLMPMYGEGLTLIYDKDQIEALQEDMTEKYSRYGKAAGAPFLSRDEARAALGYDELGGPYAEVVTPMGLRVDALGNEADPIRSRKAEPLGLLRSRSRIDSIMEAVAA